MSQRYERIAATEENSPITPQTPNSPPPSFRSQASSITSRQHRSVDPTLADTFDADGADSDEENDGDDRQRLMRGQQASPLPSPSTEQPVSLPETRNAPAAPPQPERVRRPTQLPVFRPTTNRVYGGGSGSDGVFANLAAKPEVGEKTEEHPPTYEQAAADSAPPYWETTILAPGLGGPDEVFIEGLPVGSVFSFVWNLMISLSFQLVGFHLVGFLLTYLLHTSHAAKNGSLVGLGITIVQYGFYVKGSGLISGSPGQDPQYSAPSDPNSHDFDPDRIAKGTDGDSNSDQGVGSIPPSEWLAYAMMVIGWFILIRAVSDYMRVRRHEQLVLQSPDRGLNVPIIAETEGVETVV